MHGAIRSTSSRTSQACSGGTGTVNELSSSIAMRTDYYRRKGSRFPDALSAGHDGGHAGRHGAVRGHGGGHRPTPLSSFFRSMGHVCPRKDSPDVALSPKIV